MRLWEDKQVRFDVPLNDLKLRAGEQIIDRLENIEDTKGNLGERGRLIITNIRILWSCIPNSRINLSIGFNCIITISIRKVKAKFSGSVQALNILTISNKSKFEFIFTNQVPGSSRHFTSIVGVHKAFLSSRVYREFKIRGAIIQNKQLRILPLEQVFSTLFGVWNLSSDQGSLGTFVITNVRCVWFADTNDGFNISLPYLQINSIIVRDSKFGQALVLTSSEESGSYVLGFRIHPEDKLMTLYKELLSVYATFINNPIFGVEYALADLHDKTDHHADFLKDFECLEEPKGELGNTIPAYLSEEKNLKDVPHFYPDLGLAVEAVKETFTLNKLWEVVPSV